jgi:hypothetical protein
MKQDKINLNELLVQIQELDKKYLIQDFSNEIKTLFSGMNISPENIEEIIKNPFSVFDQKIGTDLESMDPKLFDTYINTYRDLKKKYNYDKYVKEGHALRKKFLQQRKSYIFNSAKFIKFEIKGKCTILEKLNIDYAEQYFIAKWIDKLLKKIYPNSLLIEYEDLSGAIKTAEIAYRKVELTADYVSAPLIDRFVGESLFDSFLVHSFYNVETDAYQYFPVKFIVNMRPKESSNSITFDGF